ncbi:MAG: GspH/FimT family pseudopilin [Gammaproteobacteria bacterium]|jgi:type IV fimbrial biogenesis protein FimT|nr:GspH/FimT family pseudopilin [Gammaproteobacteria bacterium]
MKKISGFTLLELMITMTLVSLVMAIGIPSMRDFIKNDRLVTQINTMVGHLAYARSEAVTRHQTVIICASSNQTSCSSSNWAEGWILFVDTDNNADFSAGEDMLRQHVALSGGTTFTSSVGSVVTYDERGFAPNSIGTFSLCDDRGTAHMKSISISATGRVRQGGSTSC